ncbi:protein of unknown function [Parasphingorhabdus marina DSM 22363]|uniref:DUF4349 domain-containing protein n=1 Tax=Parasphingorhabdus marina DSM 22363 TaxID=1123272 RepID=A0A1N6CM43_9SPHN|nr:protein of unknown function [Parasphingorhabdus marina DSM 22363]
MVLAACSDGSETAAEYEAAEYVSADSSDASAPQNQFGMMEAMSTGPFDSYDESDSARAEMQNAVADARNQSSEPAQDNDVPVSSPQIAYSYDFGYRISAGKISGVQKQHAAYCEQQGPAVCRVINLKRSGDEASYAYAMLHLEVAADRARSFGTGLTGIVEEAGGYEASTSIEGEDLSKQIVDTEARLRSRELLSERLTELLQTRSGTVEELVKAERAVTEVNEEIDKARSWLKEMRGRIAFSKVVVNYESNAPGTGSFTAPIRRAWNNMASMLGSSIGALITIVTATLPWILVLALAIYLRRRFKSANRTFWGRKRKVAENQED